MKFKTLFLALLAAAGLTACNEENTNEQPETPQGVFTYMDVSITLPHSKTKALPEDYNPDGIYEGHDAIETLDIYMQSADGTIERKRFTGSELTTDGTTVSPSQAFRTTSGNKNLYVVINDPKSIGNTITSETELVDIEDLARTTNVNGRDYDVIMMTGKERITVLPDVSSQQVITGTNKFKVEVVRVASRVIVTTEAAQDVMSGGVKIGTISSLTYSVAQGTRKIYWIGQPDNVTYGTDYVPALGNYAGTGNAEMYYDYSDLYTPETIPALPAASEAYKEMSGKFLFENTHMEGDVRTSQYKKGNTAYVLVRAKFTPEMSAIADGGALINGTFYVGHADGKIYSSLQSAQEASSNQKVSIYEEGKVLYYAWLNPDNIQKPYNSPVVRNNIYHINITGFTKLGWNWNPLFPEDPDTENPQNPDPKPVNPYEPEIPIDPVDPLSPEETFMSVEVTVKPWTVHSYDIEF